MDATMSESELPGAGYGFHDVTAVFEAAAAEMDPGSVLFMDGFSLQDAMGAFEIGEPRLDTGLVIEEQHRPPFDPLQPLLPEELCWIIDRSFSYEMEWHSGNFLSHTVFCCVYVHKLAEIDPDLVLFPPATNDQSTHSRPLELIVLVLRAAILGLLKCCDLSWRELYKGGVLDGEDWQSDKCEVSLCEGISVRHVLSKLEEAAVWLSNAVQLPLFWRNALRARILFRKAILAIMDCKIHKDQPLFKSLIAEARVYLQAIWDHPAPEFEPGTPPHMSFDPYIARRLNTFAPIRVLPIPPFEKTWHTLKDVLDAFIEINSLSVTDCISSWEVVGNLRMWLREPSLHIPYVRSFTQSTFYDGLLVLDKFTFAWMVDRFFFETIGIRYKKITELLGEQHERPSRSLQKVERSLYRLITPYIRAQWHNPPRRRRYFMKSVFEWHTLYDNLTSVVDGLDSEKVKSSIVQEIPKVSLLWRLGCMREIVFSGFQLDLYTHEEIPFAYWYATHIMDAHLMCIDHLLPKIPQDSVAFKEMIFHSQWITALHAISTAFFVVSLPFTSLDWKGMRPNFYRRYKWAFRPEYEDFETPVVAHPDLLKFMEACSEVLKDQSFSPSGSIEFARVLLVDLFQTNNAGGWAGQWSQDRLQLVSDLIAACERASTLPASMQELEEFDAQCLKWDPEVHPWFPATVTSNLVT